MRGASARAPRRAGTTLVRRPPAPPREPSDRPAARAPCRGSDRCRPGVASGRVTTTSGVRPVPLIQRLFGVSQRAMVSLKAPPSPLSSCHCWTVPLPNDCWPTRRARPVSWSAPATISLADALPPSISTTTSQVGAGRDAVAERLGRDLVPLRVLLPEDRAGRDELAGDLACRRDVATRVPAQVEDELRPAGREVCLQGGHHVVGRRVREAREPDVADRPVGQDPALDLLGLDHVARDRQLDRCAAAAAQGERHDRALRAADPVPRTIDRQPVEGRAIDRDHDVTDLDARLVGRRARRSAW